LYLLRDPFEDVVECVVRGVVPAARGSAAASVIALVVVALALLLFGALALLSLPLCFVSLAVFAFFAFFPFLSPALRERLASASPPPPLQPVPLLCFEQLRFW